MRRIVNAVAMSILAAVGAASTAHAEERVDLLCETSPQFPAIAVSFTPGTPKVTIEGRTVPAEVSEHYVSFLDRMGGSEWTYKLSRVSGEMQTYIVGKPETIVRFRCKLARRLF